MNPGDTGERSPAPGSTSSTESQQLNRVAAPVPLPIYRRYRPDPSERVGSSLNLSAYPRSATLFAC